MVFLLIVLFPLVLLGLLLAMERVERALISEDRPTETRAPAASAAASAAAGAGRRRSASSLPLG
jgi:hypothetical protein